MDTITTFTVIGALANVFVALGTVLLAIFAFRGIEAWRLQVSADFDLREGKALLTALRQLKATINTVRQGLIFEGENIEDRPIKAANAWREFIHSSEHLTPFWGDEFKSQVEEINNFMEKYDHKLRIMKTLTDKQGRPMSKHIDLYNEAVAAVYGNDTDN